MTFAFGLKSKSREYISTLLVGTVKTKDTLGENVNQRMKIGNKK